MDEDFRPRANAPVNRIRIQPNGRILLAGTFTELGGDTRHFCGRLDADGTTDPTFKDPQADLPVRAVDLQVDGKIARLHSDGSLDAEFVVREMSWVGSVEALALQPDGKIVAGGQIMLSSGLGLRTLIRLNADGSPDFAFATRLGPSESDSQIASLALQADGKLLVGGHLQTLGGEPHRGIARLHPDGGVDASFRSEVSGDVSTSYSRVFSAPVQPDGKILRAVDHGLYQFTDPHAASHPQRFYQLRTLDTGIRH